MSVPRRVVALTLDNLIEMPEPCRSCLFWEVGPAGEQQELDPDLAVLTKEAWLSATLLDWGSCGKIVYVDTVAVGHALFAPPGFVPRSTAFPTSPVSGDAVLLMSARVSVQWRSGGIGRMLAQAVAAELVGRGVKAIEAFGSAGGPGTVAPVGGPPVPEPSSCLLPADFLRSVGFKTVRAHPRFPRMRMELKSTVSWRYDVEYALERILASALGKQPVPAG